jgi:integrase
MQRLLDSGCRSGENNDLTHAALALQVIFPDLFEETEFSFARHFLLPQAAQIHWLASQVKGSIGRMQREVESYPIVSTFNLIARTELHSNCPSLQARRYFSALLVEGLLQGCSPESSEIRALGMAVRGEIERAAADSHVAIREKSSLLEFIEWFRDTKEATDRLPKYLMGVKEQVCRIAYRSLFHPPTALDIGSPGSGDEPVSFDEVSVGEALSHPPGFLPEEPTLTGQNLSPAATRALLERSGSTQLRLASLTTASVWVLSDGEMQREVDRLYGVVEGAHDNKQQLELELALSRLLIAGTGVSPVDVNRIQWGHQDDVPNPSGTLLMDCQWLLRHELRPPRAASGREDRASGVVWIPVPIRLSELLKKSCIGKGRGQLVFPVLGNTSAGTVNGQDAYRGGPPAGALQRTLLSRLARSEPLGITAAQWIACDSLGLSTVPMHYDRIAADRLAWIVEGIVNPWFGHPSRCSRGVRPVHHLGSRVFVPAAVLKAHYASLSRAGAVGEVEQLRLLVRNTLHGFVQASGHRPSDSLGRLTAHQISTTHRFAILTDKSTSADWRDRPVALPEIWIAEYRGMLFQLRRFAERDPESALGRAASDAISGLGPVFLDIQSADDVRPYTRERYVSELPTDLQPYPNFARHLLNRELLASTKEALRVGQMGWHGDREGCWAFGSPWSLVEVANTLEPALHRMLKQTGWRRISKSDEQCDAPPIASIDWRAQIRRHQAEFAAHVRRLRVGMAKQHAALWGRVLPRVQQWFAHELPALKIDGRLGLVRRSEATDHDVTEPVAFTKRKQLDLILAVTGGARRDLKVAVIRNMLSTLMTKARKRGIASGPSLQRVHWSLPRRPGSFNRMMPSAMAHAAQLDAWIEGCAQANGKTNESGSVKGDSLSEAGMAFVAITLHSGYPGVRHVLQILRRDATLRRSSSDPSVLLVDVPYVIDEESAKDGVSPSMGCYALDRLAALHLLRWHGVRGSEEVDPERLARELFDALPDVLKPPRKEETLEHLAAVASLRRTAIMDGLARMIAEGVVESANVSAARVIELRAGLWLGASVRERAARPELIEASRRSALRRHASLHEVYELMVESDGASERNGASDAAQIAWLGESLSRLIHATPRNLKAADLVARFAWELCANGGLRKKSLRLRTIKDAVYAVATHLVAALPEHPLSVSEESWQTAYANVVLSATESARHFRLSALGYFHQVLGRAINLPSVSFADLAALAGVRLDSAAAGFFTSREIEEIEGALARDADDLHVESASPEDLHLARARQVAAELLANAGLRPGETHGLKRRDVLIGANRTSIWIRKSNTQSLKTANARRQVVARLPRAGAATSPTIAWMGESVGGGRTGAKGREPLFNQLAEVTAPLDRDDILGRISEIGKHVTGIQGARPYWFRKHGIWTRFDAYSRMEPDSLWTLRDLLAEIAHSGPEVSVGWYLHDPIVVFARWFRTQRERPSAARIAVAIGLSESRVSRSGNLASREGLTDRVASLLQRIPLESAADERQESIPALHAARGFSPDAQAVEQILTRVAMGDDVDIAATRARWPKRAQVRLAEALIDLRANFLVAFVPADGVKIVLVPPRRVQGASALAEWMAMPENREVVLEMATSWLAHAALPGLPEGVPGTSAEWQRWAQQNVESCVAQWAVAQRGALLIKRPASQLPGQVAAWPVLRWLLVSAYLSQKLRGN